MNDTLFDQFWILYPRKVAKRNAEKAWRRMTDVERRKAIEAIPNHARMWEDVAFIPYPATWLNGARWDDEIKYFGPTLKQVVTAWWTTHEGVEKKARELGMQAKRGESYADFKTRVAEADKMSRAA